MNTHIKKIKLKRCNFRRVDVTQPILVIYINMGGNFAKKCDNGQLAFAADKTFYIIYGYFYTFIPKKQVNRMDGLASFAKKNF